MNLRKLAQGRACMVRLPGCTGGGESTVLTHYRLSGLSGMGQKPPDVCGAWACFSCHEMVDRRDRIGEYESVRLAHAEGCLRTIAALAKEGYLWAD